MKTYISQELGIKITHPDGWEPVNNNKYLTDIFGMSEEEAQGTGFVLVRDSESEEEFALFIFGSDDTECSTEEKYEKAMEEAITAFKDVYDEVSLKDTAKTASGKRIDKIICKDKIEDEFEVFTIYYFLHINDQLVYGNIDDLEAEDGDLVKMLEQIMHSVEVSKV